jgi:hypothetical protein
VTRCAHFPGSLLHGASSYMESALPRDAHTSSLLFLCSADSCCSVTMAAARLLGCLAVSATPYLMEWALGRMGQGVSLNVPNAEQTGAGKSSVVVKV